MIDVNRRRRRGEPGQGQACLSAIYHRLYTEKKLRFGHERLREQAPLILLLGHESDGSSLVVALIVTDSTSSG